MKTKKQIVAAMLLEVGHKEDTYLPNRFLSSRGMIDLNFTGKAKLTLFHSSISEIRSLDRVIDVLKGA